MSEPRESDITLADLLPPRLGSLDWLQRTLFARGVSARNLVRPFHKPARPRLLATVVEPLPGERSGGMALRAGHFLIAGKRVGIDAADYTGTSLAPPLARAIHRFEWLADLEAAGTRDKVAPVAEDVLRRWLLVNHDVGVGGAFTPANAGHRLLNWLIHAPLILSGSDKAFRAGVLRHVDRTAGWLDRQVRRNISVGEALPAWAAIIAAGLLMPDGKPRRLYGEAGLIAALGDAVGEDGGMLTRSPLDQIEAIELLLRLVSCYRACRRDPPAQIDVMLSLLAPALIAITHADGSTGSWQGAPPISGHRIGMLLEAGGHSPRPLRDPLAWGYHRISARQSVLQFDAAPPPSAKRARNGCPSTLAFEFSHRDQRIVVNCGGASLAGAGVPRRIETGLRSTAAHSTLTLGEGDSTLIEADGRLGSGVRAVTFDRRSEDRLTVLNASHDGFVARHGLFHERQLSLSDDGLTLTGIDALVPRGRRAKRGDHAFEIRFHLGQGIETGHALAGEDGGAGFALALPDGSYWHFRCANAKVATEESLWVDPSGHPRPIVQIVLSGDFEREGGQVHWSLRRAG